MNLELAEGTLSKRGFRRPKPVKYLPHPRHFGVMVREDALDEMDEASYYNYLSEMAPELSADELSELESRRSERKDIKMDKKRAKADVKQAKADKKRAKGEAKIIKAQAKQSYQKVSDQGVAIKPKSVLDMLDRAENSLIKEGNFNPLIDTHKPVAQVIQQLKQMTGTERVSFTKLEQMRSAATGLKASNEAATRKFAGDLVNEIDNYIGSLKGGDLIAGKEGIDKAVSSVQSARKDWRNMSKATILEDALNVAEARALDVKASENELIRRQLINLAANKKKMAQFSEAEQNAITSVAKGGRGDPVLSLIARFNPERSQLTIAGSMFGIAVNPLTATVPAAGFAADKYLGYARGKAMQGLISDVAGGTLKPPSPLYGWRGMLAGVPMMEQQ